MLSTSTRAIPHPARHAATAATPPWRLLARLALSLRGEYLATIPSNLAWMILFRKYDAFTTDAAYDEAPQSWLGPLGWWADRRVRQYAIHVALRERLRIVARELVDALEHASMRGNEHPRLLSAPCGLCRDLLQAAAILRERRPELSVAWFGLDLDHPGDVLREARRRAEAAGVPVTLARQDVFQPGGLLIPTSGRDRFQVVNCIGLTAWLDLPEVDRLVGILAGCITPGGRLIIDNWAEHEQSASGQDLEIATRYHDPADFADLLSSHGLRVARATTTHSGACTVLAAEKQ